MPLDIIKLLAAHEGQNYDLHREHINPQWARALRTIGFDRLYTKAQGQYLWDTQGAKYLDFMGGWAALSMGRNHPAIRKAMVDFLNREYPSLVAFDAPLLSGLLAAELKKRTGNRLEYVFFTNSGTEGIEAAIKFARCATGRSGLVHARKSFHGLTSGALSLNGDESFREGFGPLLPECRAVAFNDLPALEHALANRDVAAFIVEPIQGKGVNIPSPGYLREAAALCHKHGTLFVVDEVQTGIGRTGKFLAIDHEGGPELAGTPALRAGSHSANSESRNTTTPFSSPGSESRGTCVDADIIVLSKALSGGYVPVGAVLTRKSVWEKVFSSMDRAIVHSSTFHQGSLAMVAGLASLSVLDDEKLMANAARTGKLIMDGLNAMKDRFELIKEVRGRGLIIGIEFGQPKSLGLRTAWSLIHKMNADLFPQAVVIPLMDDHRIITQVAGHHIDVVKLTPPLNITNEDVTWFLNAFEQVMVELHKFPGPVWEVMKKLSKHALPRRSDRPREPAAT